MKKRIIPIFTILFIAIFLFVSCTIEYPAEPQGKPKIGNLNEQSGTPATRITINNIENISDDIQKVKVFVGEQEGIVTYIDETTIQFYVPMLDEGNYDLYVESNGKNSNSIPFTVTDFEDLGLQPGEIIQEMVNNYELIINNMNNNLFQELVDIEIISPYEKKLLSEQIGRINSLLLSIHNSINNMSEDELIIVDNVLHATEIDYLFAEFESKLGNIQTRGVLPQFKKANALLIIDLSSALLSDMKVATGVSVFILSAIGLAPVTAVNFAITLTLSMLDSALDGFIPSDMIKLEAENAVGEFGLDIGSTRNIEYLGTFTTQSDPKTETFETVVNSALTLLPEPLNTPIKNFIINILASAGMNFTEKLLLEDFQNSWQSAHEIQARVNLKPYNSGFDYLLNLLVEFTGNSISGSIDDFFPDNVQLLTDPSIISLDIETMDVEGVKIGWTELNPHVFSYKPVENSILKFLTASLEFPRTVRDINAAKLLIYVDENVDFEPPVTTIEYAGIDYLGGQTQTANAYICWNAIDNVSTTFLYDVSFIFKGDNIYWKHKTEETIVNFLLNDVQPNDTLFIYVAAYDESGNRDNTQASSGITIENNPLDDPILDVEPNTLNLTAGHGGYVYIKNISTGSLFYTVEVTVGENWLSTNLPGGSILPFSEKIMTIGTNENETNIGLNFGRIRISSDYGTKNVDVYCTENPPPEEIDAPDLWSPENGIADLDPDGLTIVWFPVNNASNYYLEVSPYPSFSYHSVNQFVNNSQYVGGLGNVIYFTFESAIASKTYYWKVKAQGNSGGFGDYSETWSFSTGSGGGDNNNPQISVDPTTVDFGSSSTSKFVWVENIGGGSLNYSSNVTSGSSWLSISSGGSGSLSQGEKQQLNMICNRDNLQTGTNNGSISIQSNGGNTSFNVTATKSGGGSEPQLYISDTTLDFGEIYNTLTTSIENIGSGVLEYNTSITSGSSWLDIQSGGSGSLGAGQYNNLVVYCDRDNLNSGVNTGNISVTSNGGNTSLNVTATKSGGSPPLAPTLSSPSNGATNVSISGNKIYWYWNAVPNAEYYEWQISQTSDFSNIWFTHTVLQGTNTWIYNSWGLLQNSTTYYWRVRAHGVGVNNFSPWSSVWSFTTEP